MPAHLAVRRTPDAGEGLFATAPIEEGHIVGFYTGEAFPEAAFDARHDAAARELYAMVVELASQMRVVLSPVSSSTGSLEAELRQHPLAAANEPRAGDRANTLMVHLEVDPAALTGAVRRSVRERKGSILRPHSPQETDRVEFGRSLDRETARLIETELFVS